MQLTTAQIMLMIQEMEINEQYEQILQPKTFVKNFKSLTDFKEWCFEGSILDLEEALKVFESNELYEYCSIIFDVIKTKTA